MDICVERGVGEVGLVVRSSCFGKGCVFIEVWGDVLFVDDFF